ncbi:MAG TPA: hypothetical protein VN228_21805 [Pyrinomonadaceae bacterium]|nr:hypothetical protein [Pyrinomonadaceae bacterium]
MIWVATGLVFGTFFLYPLALDEPSGQLDWQYFLQLEALLVLVISVMFFIYGRKG